MLSVLFACFILLMQIINLKELHLKEEFILREIRKGSILIYPTDTIYGMGCDATNEEAVKKVRKIKKRYDKPFSVIAPSKDWIRKNCVVPQCFRSYIKKLPGAFTFILHLRNKKAVSKAINLNLDTIGVRIPKHKFAKLIRKTKKPFLTTSVNITNKKYSITIDGMPIALKQNCIVIDAGKLDKKPSLIIDLTRKVAKISKRDN